MLTEFSEKVAKSFYVDDFNSTAKDISKGIEIYKKIKLRFLDASVNVLKWKTNNPDFQNYFNKWENQFSPASEIQANDKVKVLRILWDTKRGFQMFLMNCMGFRMLRMQKANGCCLYLKCVTKNNFISTSLVASNSRVSPYKNPITITRLNLLGNLIYLV